MIIARYAHGDHQKTFTILSLKKKEFETFTKLSNSSACTDLFFPLKKD